MTLNEIVRLLGDWSVGKGPTYHRLAQAFVQLITQGDIPAQTSLPAERVLATKLAISRSTVVAAYTLLRQEGWVTSRQGSRTRVLAQPDARLSVGRNNLNTNFSRLKTLLDETSSVIDFTLGAPSTLPAFAEPAFAISATDSTTLLTERGYAAFGLSILRQAIAAHYSESGLPTRAEQILITNGAQQAIWLIAQSYLQAGDSVFVENPTYFGAIDAFRATGAHLVAVRTESAGLNPMLLRAQLNAGLPRLVYLQPTFQNPTGTVLSENYRRQLVALAAEFDVPLVEDNTMGELWLQAPPPPLLATYANNTASPVLTIGSLSKTVWTGLRIGWIRGPEPIINRLARLRVVNDLGSSYINQLIAARLVGDTARLVGARRAELQLRLATLSDQLHEFLPQWEWQPPGGGLFLWIKLPCGDAASFAQVGRRFGVAVVVGNTLSVNESHPNYIRLPFLLDEPTQAEGVKRLAQAWVAYQPFLQSQLSAPQIL